MCHNSIKGGHMNFILGSQHKDDPQRVRRKMVAIATTVAYQRGHSICSLWSNISKTKTSINFQIGVYIQQEIWVTWSIFLEK